MKQLISLGVLVLLAAVGIAIVAVARSNTVPGSVKEQPASPVISEPSAGHQGKTTSQKAESVQTGKGIAAIGRAARAKKYLFAFFWKEQDDQTLAMRKVFQAAMEKVADRADSVEVDVTAASEKAIVDKFKLDRAPMPLVLALAPNGAVTGGFPTKLDQQELIEAFATPCTEKCMKSLQDGKLVFLCVQNATTESNASAMQGVHDFKADARFGHATEVVALDPAESAEAEFLAQLQIAPETTEAVTVFLAPPGTVVAKFVGATNKEELIETLDKASTSCGPGGCGPGGCGPKR